MRDSEYYLTINKDGKVTNCSEGAINVSIPSNAYALSRNAFERCITLMSITIPYGVRYMSGETFAHCINLREIKVAENNENFSSVDGILYSKDKKTILCYPKVNESNSFEIPSGVEIINSWAFCNCKSLESIIIPESVTKIYQYAFWGCKSLKSITIPEKVAAIGSDAFGDCIHLREIIVDKNNPNYSSVDGILYNKDMTTLCRYPENKEGDSFIIPNSVTQISTSAFYGCKKLKSITIQERVTTIDERAFAGCTSLESINIPKDVNKIGKSAFADCTSLKSINIPNDVKEINESAFAGCTSLESINIPNDVKEINESTFAGCTSLKSITIPGNVTTIYGSAFAGCAHLREINTAKENQNYTSVDGILYSKDMTTLCRYPEGKEIDSFIFPDSVTQIGNGAFMGFTKLESITIPDRVIEIGSSAFRCTSLRSISLPGGVIEISSATFRDCTGLNEVKLSNNVYLIDGGAFENCTSLKSVTLHNDVYNNDTSRHHYIDDYAGCHAFEGCTSLERFDCPQALEKIGMYAFSGCINLKYVEFHDSKLEKIYAHAFDGCEMLKHIDIPPNVFIISDRAFKGTGLISIEIPQAAVGSGDDIFEDCESLSRIIITEKNNIIEEYTGDSAIFQFHYSHRRTPRC